MYSSLQFAAREIWRKLTGRWLGFGMACANFGDPLSLKAWSRDHKFDVSTMEKAEFFAAVETLGQEITQRIVEVIPVLAVPVLSMILLERASPADEKTLLEEAEEIVGELRGQGAHIGFDTDGRGPTLEDGLRLMVARGLLTEDKAGLLSPAYEEKALLQYYANSVVQLRANLGKQ